MTFVELLNLFLVKTVIENRIFRASWMHLKSDIDFNNNEEETPVEVSSKKKVSTSFTLVCSGGLCKLKAGKPPSFGSPL